jgi:hypothetical protein
VGPDQRPEDAIGERLALRGFDRRRQAAAVFRIEVPPVPGPLLVTVSTYGEAPASAFANHKAAEFVRGAAPDVELRFQKFKLEEFRFLPGSLASTELHVKFQLRRPDGSRVRAELNMPIKVKLTLQTCRTGMTGMLTYQPHDEYARPVPEKPSIRLGGRFGVAVLPKTPPYLVGDLGLGHGMVLLPLAADQLAAPIPEALTSHAIKQVVNFIITAARSNIFPPGQDRDRQD